MGHLHLHGFSRLIVSIFANDIANAAQTSNSMYKRGDVPFIKGRTQHLGVMAEQLSMSIFLYNEL
jgi:hypothetical protein